MIDCKITFSKNITQIFYVAGYWLCEIVTSVFVYNGENML